IDEEFERYLEREDFTQYEHLAQVLRGSSRLLKEALLDDPVLRPVFLQVLTEEEGQIGPLQGTDVNQEALKAIGGEALLEAHSVFSVGLPSVANNSAGQGARIVVGVTDRSSEDTIAPNYEVANGRQVFFPLEDGTWLGIKGVGQMSKEEEDRTYFPDNVLGGINGLALESEAKVALDAMQKLGDDKDRGFVQFLGYRRLHSIPDGTGEMSLTENLTRSGGDPYRSVLIFNRLISPHSFVKFPQLIQADPGLRGLSSRISKALVSLQRLREGELLTGREMLLASFGEVARAVAVLQNHELFRSTFHSQDIRFFQLSDNEETVGYDDYWRMIQKGVRFPPGDFELFQKHHLATIFLQELLGALLKMMDEAQRRGQPEFFSEPHDFLRAVFQNYFSTLDDRYLEVWATAQMTPVAGLRSLPLEVGRMVPLTETLDVFHPNYKRLDLRPFNREVHMMILEWAQAEFRSRHSAVNGFLRRDLPADLLEDPHNIEKYRRADLGGVPVIPRRGLFAVSGQFAHWAFGQVYYEPVMYIDEDYINEPRVLNHELYEINRWEEFFEGRRIDEGPDEGFLERLEAYLTTEVAAQRMEEAE
ncbi:MAG: hypothetical protein NUV91_02885, partial [Candidatus Omnitrophica bacterium]|nr:hypothetical protein [Candidatus Omnitrophota bacterium]